MNILRGIGAALVLALLGGCGGTGNGVAVTGKVLFDGKPVKDGTITFIPVEGTNGPTAGTNVTDGSFSIPRDGGPVPGKYRVEVSSYEDVKPASDKEMAGALFGRPTESFAGAPKQMIRTNVVPPRYNKSSELTATIPDVSSHEVSFTLSKK